MADLVEAMRRCEQAAGQSVLAHGEAVHARFLDLRRHLIDGAPCAFAWRLPDWTGDPRLRERCLPLSTMRAYHVNHDCGKPWCRTVDAEGKAHFPRHAAKSAELWLAAGGDAQVGRLIAMDMDAHLLKADGVPEFAARPDVVRHSNHYSKNR